MHKISTQHCLREANKVADKLASLIHNLTNAQIYSKLNAIPGIVKGFLNMDKWKFPSFRAKKCKPSFLIYNPL